LCRPTFLWRVGSPIFWGASLSLSLSLSLTHTHSLSLSLMHFWHLCPTVELDFRVSCSRNGASPRERPSTAPAQKFPAKRRFDLVRQMTAEIYANDERGSVLQKRLVLSCCRLTNSVQCQSGLKSHQRSVVCTCIFKYACTYVCKYVHMYVASE
jgi:hypothetical protein